MTAGNGSGFPPFTLMGFPELPEKTMNAGTVKFSTGAVRSSDANGTRYDLVSPIGLRRLAETEARVQVKRVDILPEGWLGKCHACHVGASAATGIP